MDLGGRRSGSTRRRWRAPESRRRETVTASSEVRTTSAAGRISAQWKGALTLSGMALPLLSATRALARATPWAAPAITICPGALKFAGLTTTPISAAACAHSCSSRDGSMPITALIAPSPGGTASCMALPRRCTTMHASSTRSAPRGDQGRVLAERVPGGERGRRERIPVSLAERGEERDRGRDDRRLGVGGERELGLRALEAEAREHARERGLAGERGVDACVHVARGGRGLGQRLAHPHHLRPLTREQPRHLHERRGVDWAALPGKASGARRSAFS